MRLYKFMFMLSLCCSVMAIQKSNAQIYRDSLFWVMDPSVFRLDAKVSGAIAWNASYSITPKAKRSISAIPNTQLRKMKAPPMTKRINGNNIILKLDRTCVSISCKKGQCKECQMFWRDVNRDGKIQPKKELRCVCPETGKACELTGRKTRC